MVELRIAVEDGAGLAGRELEAPPRLLECLREAGMRVEDDSPSWVAYEDDDYRFIILRRSLRRAVQLLDTGDVDAVVGFGDAYSRSGLSDHYAGSVRMKGDRPRFKFWVLSIFHRDLSDPTLEQTTLALEEFFYLVRLQGGSGGKGGSLSEGARH